MSCEDVRAYLEVGGKAERPLVSRPALEEHIASCPECAAFSEEQERLRASFNLLRERTPPVPSSLDQTVLAGYREHMRGLALVVPRPRRPARRFALWAAALASVAAFALAIGYADLAWFTRAPQAFPRAPIEAAPRVPSTDEVRALARASATKAAAETTQTKPFRAHARTQGVPRAQSEGESGLLPVGFRGLMYCDELSCAGAMDLIRVEVPAEALGDPLRARPGSQPVEADVLVGPDGVARGIRVVE